MFGNNLDVLPPDTDAHGGGYGFGGGMKQGADSEEIAEAELVLDVSVLDDGLCVGPDEEGLVNDLIEDLDQQWRAAQAAAGRYVAANRSAGVADRRGSFDNAYDLPGAE